MTLRKSFPGGQESIPSRHLWGQTGRTPGPVDAANAVDIEIRAESEAGGQTDRAGDSAASGPSMHFSLRC